jgi:integrase/recombinase XerD
VAENLYRRGKTWYARVQVQGADQRRSLRTTVLAVAKKRLESLLKEAEAARAGEEGKHRWIDAVLEWERNPGVKPSVVDRYLSSIAQLRGILDPLNVEDISRKTIGLIARRPASRTRPGAAT